MQRADDAKSKAEALAKMFPSMRGMQPTRRDNTSTSSLSFASLSVTHNSGALLQEPLRKRMTSWRAG